MKLIKKIKELYFWIVRKLAQIWLRAKLMYWVAWAKRSCYPDKTVYYVLLDPTTREVWCVNQNEYIQLNRNLRKKEKMKLKRFVYAKISPWG